MRSPAVALGMLVGLLAGLAAPPLAASEFPADRIFAGSGGNDRVLVYGTGGKLGSAVGGATALQDPGALVFGPDGRLWVASRSTGEVHGFDPDLGLVATFGAALGITDPTALAFTPDGTLLVADDDSDTLREITLDGTLAGVFGDGLPLADVRDLLFGPDGHLYVASAADQAVLELRPDGSSVATLGAGEGLSDPASLAFDDAGRLFVSSGDADEILVLARDGTVDARLSAPGTLERPGGLAFLGTGELVVVSRDTDRLVVLDAAGAVQDSFGSGLSAGWDVAVSPFRFQLKLKGELVVQGGASTSVKQSGSLSVQPGGLQLMVALDALEETAGVEAFGSRYLVLTGFELAGAPDDKQRLFSGSWLRGDAETAGAGSLALEVKGKVDKKQGNYVVKKASGSLLRASADGVFVGDAKSAKKLNK